MQSTVVFGNSPSVSLSSPAFRRFRCRRRHVNFSLSLSLSISSHFAPLHFAVSNLPTFLSISLSVSLSSPSLLSFVYPTLPFLVFPPLSFLKLSFVSSAPPFPRLPSSSFSLSLLLPLSFQNSRSRSRLICYPRQFLVVATLPLSLFPARTVHSLFVRSLEFRYLSFYLIHLPRSFYSLFLPFSLLLLSASLSYILP